MEKDGHENKIYIILAIILGILILISIFLLFKRNIIEVDIKEPEEVVSIIDIPGLGEKSDPLKKKEPDVDITVMPEYHGSFSLDKIADWIEDPSELIDNTSLNIEGSIKF